MPDFLRFGIPSLDKLVGTRGGGDYGVRLTRTSEDVTGICVMGPDGTGKSVFALHLAGQYLADCLYEREGDGTIRLPKIYYISTDLDHDKATRVWDNFALGRPFDRQVPFEKVQYRDEARLGGLRGTEIELRPYGPQEVVDYVYSSAQGPAGGKKHQVCFINLAATTAGDDWGFVHRLLALTQKPDVARQPRHLVIIDAIEGFETYVGRVDAFGETSSRRARIAQLARLAVKKCHTLLIVEEMRTMERLPEEFVADVVIRLRNVEANKYLRRTVEIEKARGQSLIRGQHPFSIRKGKGSTTGSQVNIDDPEMLALEPGGDYPHQDYVQVFPSLNYINRAIMEATHAPKESQDRNQYAAFGLPYLDNMLGGEGFEAESRGEYDTRGLPCGTVTALIGDSLTQKTRLGRSFLSRCFHPFKEPDTLRVMRRALNRGTRLRAALDEIRAWKGKRTGPVTGLAEDSPDQEFVHRKLAGLKRWVAARPDFQELLQRCGVAVLFTTLDTHHEALADEFLDRGLSANLERDSDEKLLAEILIERRTICRRMEIHDVPASVLAHIFEQNVREAQKLLDPGAQANPSLRFKNSKRIRVVFDDFSALRNTYHEVREDPLFLPYLLFFLGREGVTALIVDTQSIGRPDLTLTERYESELRELAQHRLYTWRVPFYGENRVAITAIPPFSPQTSGAIRELRWESVEDADGAQRVSPSLGVNPHFELYTGLEEGKLQPVPIEIRFYAESQAFKRYIDAEETTFAELFVPYKREGQAERPKVLFSYRAEDYNMMRDFCSLQRGTRLDHTLIFQVDEFWTVRQPKSGRSGAFRPQWNYLTTPTWSKLSKRDAAVDPYALFQPTKEEGQRAERRRDDTGTEVKFTRLDFYEERYAPYVSNYRRAALEKAPEEPPEKAKGASLKKDLDRVPYSWDFGFLLCKGSAWEDTGKSDDKFIIRRDAGGRDDPKRRGRLDDPMWGVIRYETVQEVWDAMVKATPPNGRRRAGGKGKEGVTWFEFLAACKRVAEHQSYKNPSAARIFDFSVYSPESFPCLLLEIWASEILKELLGRGRGDGGATLLAGRLSVRDRVPQRDAAERQKTSLLEWLEPDRGMSLEECLSERYIEKRGGPKGRGYSLELYKTWLLLIEVIDLAELIRLTGTFSSEFKSKQVGTSVVAARHWYKTACEFVESVSEQELEANWVPVRLPGHFSVRGDWFLTVAGGSRSSRLADRALDLLSSKRANVNRLHEGVGLPVRRLFDGAGDDHLRTRLITLTGQEGKVQQTNLPYKGLLRIAADGTLPEAAPPGSREHFYWLWRSNLYGYHSDTRIWHRWLNQMIVWWHSLRLRYASGWTNSFEIYARLEKLRTCGDAGGRKSQCEELMRQLSKLASWQEFHLMVNQLVDSLEQVSVESD